MYWRNTHLLLVGCSRWQGRWKRAHWALLEEESAFRADFRRKPGNRRKEMQSGPWDLSNVRDCGSSRTMERRKSFLLLQWRYIGVLLSAKAPTPDHYLCDNSCQSLRPFPKKTTCFGDLREAESRGAHQVVYPAIQGSYGLAEFKGLGANSGSLSKARCDLGPTIWGVSEI